MYCMWNVWEGKYSRWGFTVFYFLFFIFLFSQLLFLKLILMLCLFVVWFNFVVVLHVYLLQHFSHFNTAGLAQSVERQALNLMVEGPAVNPYRLTLLDEILVIDSK